MWQRLGKFVLKNRLVLLIIMLLTTGLMGYYASKVKLSYEFSKAVPTDNLKYQEYLAFKNTFGDDGNMLVIGVQTDKLFNLPIFNAYQQLQQDIKQVASVEDILCVSNSVTLVKDSVTEKLNAVKIFPVTIASQTQLDSCKAVFLNLPFYQSVLYNPATHAYLMAVKINKDKLNSPGRTKIVADITESVIRFEKATGSSTHISGLPLIRTVMADRIQKEMKFFLFGSLLLSVLILLLFFRSLSTTLLSLVVVGMGVVWTIAAVYLCGYKITLLTALLPSLVVVIGIPNCIYFINKFHTSFLETGDKEKSLVNMVSKMGVVTLFCNITAAIGFAVFALTKSAILKEFGVVAGLSIMLIFVISFIVLPAVLSYLPSPKGKELKYLNNRLITRFLDRIEIWVFKHTRWVMMSTTVIVLVSVAGMFKLKSVAFIVDDLPKQDKIYTDLKFFEQHFKGIMPLEIVVDTKKPNGLRKPGVFERADSLSAFIASLPVTNRPLGVSEGFKFFYQAFSEGDSSAYVFPNEKIVEEILRKLKPASSHPDSLHPANAAVSGNALSKMLQTFIDSSRQKTRISVSMADIGTKELPLLLDTIQQKANQYFDTSKYKVTLTGTSITFLEGSRFIINGLKESIFWAFLLIAICMLYLFKSLRILVCSLVPNLIPLIITAGIMGWVGVPLKPSTVLIFSVALGIAIDITIRFLVNYRQDLPQNNNDIETTVKGTVHHTGLSIIYTSLVLMAGFIIFCGSSFGGTFALGWLTSVTLLSATLTNLVLLPVLIVLIAPKRKK
ncbi:MAG: MMPL family transporter [Bacteroidetes bacterium]|nr:MMPL family transporter [Bacteroidota bacterium]